MTTRTFIDAENIVKDWVKTTSVAALVTKTTKVNVFLAMPIGAPIPCVLIRRVGGSPAMGSDVPVDIARLSFSCYGNNRPEVKDIAKALVSEIESLAGSGGYESSEGRIHSAEVISWLWKPDSISDLPKYIIDALFTTTPL